MKGKEEREKEKEYERCQNDSVIQKGQRKTVKRWKPLTPQC